MLDDLGSGVGTPDIGGVKTLATGGRSPNMKLSGQQEAIPIVSSDIKLLGNSAIELSGISLFILGMLYCARDGGKL